MGTLKKYVAKCIEICFGGIKFLGCYTFLGGFCVHEFYFLGSSHKRKVGLVELKINEAGNLGFFNLCLF
jgi:hypothetical protein